MKETIKFLTKGTVSENTLGLFGRIKFILSRYFLILFGFLFLSTLFTWLVGAESKGNVSINHGKDIPEIAKILLVCLIGPAVEELVFRLSLKVNKRNIIISLISSMIFLFFFMKKQFIGYELYKNVFFVIILALSILFIYKYQYIEARLKNNAVAFIHILTILFCLAHFGNFNFKMDNVRPYIIMVSILLNGYYFSYIRLRFGMLYAICIHIFHNTLVSLPMIIKVF